LKKWSFLQNSYQKEKVVIPGNPGEGRGRSRNPGFSNYSAFPVSPEWRRKWLLQEAQCPSELSNIWGEISNIYRFQPIPTPLCKGGQGGFLGHLFRRLYSSLISNIEDPLSTTD
jgi:hypothetical protein